MRKRDPQSDPIQNALTNMMQFQMMMNNIKKKPEAGPPPAAAPTGVVDPLIPGDSGEMKGEGAWRELLKRHMAEESAQTALSPTGQAGLPFGRY